MPTAPASQRVTRLLGIEVPLLCGAMYPCSNPELVAAVSAAGGMGIVQPISLAFVHGRDLREGIRLIRRLTDRPIGFNAIVEKTARAYEDRMRRWVDVALDEGVRFFVTALGDPRWVVDRVHAVRNGVVFHDVTERRWAERALAAGVDGLICVNRRAGGHAGTLAPEALRASLADLGVPLVCAGGVGSARAFADALRLGYDAVQMGTRFLATTECRVHEDYKRAILRARASDIVLTERITGVPVAVIRTPFVERTGTRAGPVARRLLRHPRAKRWVRTIYALRALWQLRRASLRAGGHEDYLQAGQSVEEIDEVLPAAEVVRRCAEALGAGATGSPHPLRTPATRT